MSREDPLGRVQVGQRVDLVPAFGGEDHRRWSHAALGGHLLKHGLIEGAGLAGRHMAIESLADLAPGVARETADVDRHEVAGVGAVLTVDARRRRVEGVDVAVLVERDRGAAHPRQLPGDGDPAGLQQRRGRRRAHRTGP